MQYDLRQKINRALFGAPKRTDQAHMERLGVGSGLATFSSDALSSVAYATEEILLVLAAFGTAAGVFSLPLALGIVVLIFIVSTSYQQTIRAYPGGGGSYIVSKDNLGAYAGLVAAAALLIDYVLTVAVSISAASSAIVSAFPRLSGHQVTMALIAIWFVTWVNLRGVRESGLTFAVPTYGFIALMLFLLVTGAVRSLAGGWQPLAPAGTALSLNAALAQVGLWSLLRAFSSGCTALTGIEAVANGVQAFRAPEPDNAIKTLRLARLLLAAIFMGITLLAFGFGVAPSHGETVLSQIARHTFGTGLLYFAVQLATMAILVLASNTAYADFPRLASLVARDGFLPRPLSYRGDQLVFRTGIAVLAILASALVVVFHGNPHRLIPLYAVGVFLAFTLSQTGMVVHWLKEGRAAGALPWGKLAINGFGAATSGVVMLVIAFTKFRQGAWLVIILLPAMVWYFTRVRHYYDCFRQQVQRLWHAPLPIDRPRRVKGLLTMADFTPITIHALRCARYLTRDVTCVHVAVEPAEGERLRRQWDPERAGAGLAVLESPYRSVLGPLRDYVDGLVRQDPDLVVHLMVPVVVTTNVFDAYLHNSTGEQIIDEFRYSHNVLVTEIPFFLDMAACASPLPAGRGPVEPVPVQPPLPGGTVIRAGGEPPRAGRGPGGED